MNNIDKIIPTTYLIGIWAQLGCLEKYPFNSIERDSIIAINELLNKDLLDYNNLYKYGLYISTIVSEIKAVDKHEVNTKYNSLYIKNKTEINISALDICEILDKKPGKYLKEIFDDIEYKLVNKELKNNYNDLKDYIKEKYTN